MMRRPTVTLFVALALAGGLPGVARAEDPPPRPPVVQKTEAEAGCIYGTQPTSSFVPKTYDRSYTAAFEWNQVHNPQTDCNVTLGWFPFTRSPVSLNFTMVMEKENNDASSNNAVCAAGAADPACTPDTWAQMLSTAVTYRCSAQNDLNCISSIQAVDESGTVTEGVFVRNFPEVPRVAGSASNGAWVAEGGGTPMWEFALPSGKLTLLSNGLIETNFSARNGKWEVREDPGFRLTLFGVSVTPDATARKPTVETNDISFNGRTIRKVGVGGGIPPGCIASDTGECAREVPLPAGYRFRVTLQLPESALLFLNARLREPTAYTEPLPNGYRFVIEAAPADVLSVAQVFPKAVLQRSAVENILTKTRGDRWVFDRANVDNFSEGAGSEALLWLNEVIPIIGDRTSWVSAVWNVSTARNSRAFGSKCQARVKNSFLGVVSTNATAYSEGPPRYNESTATLEYEVAAPHFLPDGKTEAIGRYALNLNADFMTCLLGVSKVPDQAKIELTYGTGEVNAATINVKQTKNWLTLIAENFTYSSPRIKVSFPQAATATTKTVAKSKAPAKTVTCVKGKTAKKFLGTKCPRGWKKK